MAFFFFFCWDLPLLPNFGLLLTKLLYTNFIYATLVCLLVQKAKPGFYLFWFKYKSSPASLDLPPLPVFHLLVSSLQKSSMTSLFLSAPSSGLNALKWSSLTYFCYWFLSAALGWSCLLVRVYQMRRGAKNVKIKVPKEGLNFLSWMR